MLMSSVVRLDNTHANILSERMKEESNKRHILNENATSLIGS